ncbi:hypothetical protein [Vulcanisaeta sp. JCM 14467]|uniref:hypothetical protein n=1 Tax=Vulcanisaeta sp. JCM 14467 TaxID=1295370 RepID=UPI0006CF4B0E|nr:hypothetical protein [Vulcanisaeta sp. JCM 14467]
MFTQEESIRVSIIGKVGRLRVYLFLVILLLYLAAYFLGYAVKPSQQFATRVNQIIKHERSLIHELSSTSQLAAFSYELTNLMVYLGPSLIPLFGIWNTAYQWAYAGIATNAVSSNDAISIMAETILLSVILAIPSTDGLLLSLSLINYGRNRNFRDLAILSLRWYVMSTILAIVFLVLLSAIP